MQGMFSLAEPGLSLEAHRRSPVRSAGTKPDSSHRIAAAAVLCRMRDFGVGGPHPLDHSMLVFVFPASQSLLSLVPPLYARLGNLQLKYCSEVVVLVLRPSSRTSVVFFAFAIRFAALHCNTHTRIHTRQSSSRYEYGTPSYRCRPPRQQRQPSRLVRVRFQTLVNRPSGWRAASQPKSWPNPSILD
jgi:hypothetical protein